MTGAAVVGGVASLRDAVDSLLCAPVDGLPAAELLGVFAEVEMQRNRLAALDHRLIAALGESGAVLASGSTSLPDLVSAVTRCSRGEAMARVGRTVDLGPRRALSGEVLEPIHPVLAGAVAEGMVSESQCEVIVAALGRVGPDAQADAFEVAERFLVEAARVQPPAALARSARWVLSRLDPAGLEPSEKTVERVRSFWLSDGPDADGAVAAKGRLTAEAAAALRTVLDALSAPRPCTEAGERDGRSAGQRQHDALLEVALRVLRSGALPESGGIPASVIITLHADRADDDGRTPTGDPSDAAPEVAPRAEGAGQLLGRPSGIGELGVGGPVTLERLRPLLDECEITTVRLTATGGVLDYGRDRRIATPAMRRALAARDSGCCFPGCDRPPAWTQAHHVIEWLDGGPTEIDNMCLLCSCHHRMFGPAGWQVIMHDGVPTWVPPPWLDPHRRPIRNTARHVPEIDFGRTEAVSRR